MHVLIVEDDASVARFLSQATLEAGYAATVVRSGHAALDACRPAADNSPAPFQLLLLDVMLPGLNGFAVCRRLRAEQVQTPILLLTARDSLADKIEGLDSGADDYLVKPFELAELLARMRALLRRPSALPPAAVLQVADLTLDTASRRAHRAHRLIPLSATEYALLHYLLSNAGRVLSRAQILDHVWQYDFGGSDNVLDVYISYLRGKIDRGHSVPLIHTVRGVGYRLADDNGGGVSGGAVRP